MSTIRTKKHVFAGLRDQLNGLFERRKYGADLALAKLQIAAIKQQPESPLARSPKPGHLRGIDFYSESMLPNVMAVAIHNFRKFHGAPPNLLQPVSFNEKLFWTKFFANFKVPESGNKLLTRQLVPEYLRSVLACPRIVWHSREPNLPSNDDIPAGSYYLKANHGSGMNERISYPLSREDYSALQRKCKNWLENPYGLKWGEWWYNTFDKEILIETDVTASAESVSWYFYVFNGQVELVSARKKAKGLDQSTWFDGNFELALYQPRGFSRLEKSCASTRAKSKMRDLAAAVGKDFRFVRIDFLLSPEESVYLGELTFLPANAKMPLSMELDMSMGKLWCLH